MQTAVSRCEGFLTFQGLTVTLSSGCCCWFGRTITTSCPCVAFVSFSQARDGMRPVWLVGGVKWLLYLAWAVHCWSWRAFQ